MHNIIKTVLQTGNFDLADMMKKIDTFFAKGNITEEQYQELQKLAQSNAKAENSTDIIRKMIDLEKRILVLEEKLANGDNVTPDEAPEEAGTNYNEFEVGKWYYGGDKISFEGKNYECTAPAGNVCVWNPRGYPTYWKQID